MKKRFYTSSFTIVRGAIAVQNEHVFSIATKTPDDCAGMKHIPELAPGWDIVGPYKKAEKSGLDMTAAEEAYKKAYYNNVLKNLNPDIIPDGAILCCYENSSKFCHRQLVAKWTVWADKDVEYGGELDTEKKVHDVLNADINVKFNFEEETKMKNEVNNIETDTIVASAQTDTATVNAVAENKAEKKEETIEMTNNIETKAAEVRNAIKAANAAEMEKIDATKKYVALRDAARAAMVVKKIATVKKQIANAIVTIKKAEFSVIEINGKIAAAIEAGKKTTTLETRLAKANERILKSQAKLATYEEKLAGLTNAPVAETPVIETPAVEKPEVETSTETVPDHTAEAENWEQLYAELDQIEQERLAEGDVIEKDEPADEPVEEPIVEDDDKLDPIVETEDDSDEPEIPVSFAAPKVIHAAGLLNGKVVVGTVEEPKAETTAATATSLQEMIAKRVAMVTAPKQETVEKKDSAEAPKTFVPKIPPVAPAPVAQKPFVPVNPFKNVGVAAPAPTPVASKSSYEDGWVIDDVEFDEEIERDLGRNPDGTKKTWGTWVLEQQAEEIHFDTENLEVDEDGMIIMPDQPVDQWLIHGATGTKDKKKNFRDSFLNNDIYENIELGNAYNFGDESCTDHDAIMDEIYG